MAEPAIPSLARPLGDILKRRFLPRQSTEPTLPRVSLEERLLALKLKSRDPRSRRASGPARHPPPGLPPLDLDAAEPEAEEIAHAADLDEPLPYSALLPPPLPSESDADQPGTTVRTAPPPWLAHRRGSNWRDRLRAFFAWMTTGAIVAAIVGAAVIGLVGYGRTIALAGLAYGHLEALYRALAHLAV